MPLAALAGRRRRSRPRARSSTPTSSTGRGASSSACSRTATTTAARARSSCCASSTSIRTSRRRSRPAARVRVFGDVRDGHFGREIVHPQFKVVDAGHAAAGSADAGLSDDRGARAGDAAQGDRARARRRSGAHRRDRCPTGSSRGGSCGSSATRCTSCTRRRRGCRGSTQQALDARTHPAWTRLKFDELVAQQLSLKAHRKARAARRAPVLTGTGALTGELLARVPFKLTRRAGARLARDQRTTSSARCRCSGCCRATSAAARRSSRRSPRCRRSSPGGRSRSWRRPRSSPSSTTASSRNGSTGLPVEIAWLSGSLPAKARKKALAAIGSGEAMLAIGTHALFEDEVLLPRLGLAIVDEQHRFGVAQRLALRGKAMGEAHQLMMSATPIPRTLAMTFYADLDVSVIDEMPPGRTPVATRLVNQQAARRGDRARAPRVRRGPAGVLGVPADRGVGKARAADGGGAARGADAARGRLSPATARVVGRPAARPDEARRQGGGDGGVRRAARSTCWSRPR